MKPIQRYELIELLVPAGTGNRINFQDIPQLRTQGDQNIFITAIDFFSLAAYSDSQVNQAVPGTPNSEIAKAVLCLYIQGEERIHYIPLAKLNTINDGVVPFNVVATEFDELVRVDWTKSYIQFNSAIAGAPYVMPFGISYTKIAQ